MNEKNKLYVAFGMVFGVLVLVIAICMAGNQSTQKMFEEIDQKLNSETVQVFYFTKPTCHYCILLEPVTDTLQEEYGLEYNKIDVSTLNSSQLRKLLNKFEINYGTFGTPHIAVTKNGEILDHLSGYADENVVFELFQSAGLIPVDAILDFQYIDYDTFKQIWNNGQKTLIMIGQSGEESVNARNELKPYIRQNNLSVIYMDIAETGDAESYNQFLKMIGHTDQVSYPILMIFQNGTVLAETNQTAASAYEEFLRTNGYIG